MSGFKGLIKKYQGPFCFNIDFKTKNLFNLETIGQI